MRNLLAKEAEMSNRVKLFIVILGMILVIGFAVVNVVSG
jgi:hypothetical protein